jgi:hypothetical protein
MRLGILFEGEYDHKPISIILTIIIQKETSIRKIYFDPFPADGSIEAKMDKAIILFFNTTPGCDFALFLNDKDTTKDKKSKIERVKKINRFVGTFNSKNPNKFIITAHPEPCFENWYFREENALRNVLHLDSTKPIPYSDLHPKTRLKKLIDEFNDDITKSKEDIYVEVAENLDIDSLVLRDKEFEKFYNQLRKVLKSAAKL